MTEAVVPTWLIVAGAIAALVVPSLALFAALMRIGSIVTQVSVVADEVKKIRGDFDKTSEQFQHLSTFLAEVKAIVEAERNTRMDLLERVRRLEDTLFVGVRKGPA